MSRLWIGVGLLVILLALGLTMLFVSRDFHEEFSTGLEEAGQFAMAGNWTAAEKQLAKSREKWQNYRRFWASFTDHEPVEQVQNLFSQLELFQARRLDVEFASACYALAELSEAIDESHSLRWWSVL